MCRYLCVDPFFDTYLIFGQKFAAKKVRLALEQQFQLAAYHSLKSKQIELHNSNT